MQNLTFMVDFSQTLLSHRHKKQGNVVYPLCCLTDMHKFFQFFSTQIIRSCSSTMVPGTDYSYCTVVSDIANSLPMGLHSSTTTGKAYQHLKAPPVIAKSVFKLKMVRVIFMFCEKLQDICSVAANPDEMDKNGCDFWTQRPQKPPSPLQTSSP